MDRFQIIMTVLILLGMLFFLGGFVYIHNCRADSPYLDLPWMGGIIIGVVAFGTLLIMVPSFFLMNHVSDLRQQQVATTTFEEWRSNVSKAHERLRKENIGLNTLPSIGAFTNQPKLLSSSQMSYFSYSKSYEKMTMYDLLSVYKTAGTASTDEFYADLLEVLNNPYRHGSPLIRDYRFQIWLRTSTLTREWCPYDKEEPRTLTYKEKS